MQQDDEVGFANQEGYPRNLEERTLRKESNEQKSGDCNWLVGGPQKWSQSPRKKNNPPRRRSDSRLVAAAKAQNIYAVDFGSSAYRTVCRYCRCGNACVRRRCPVWQMEKPEAAPGTAGAGQDAARRRVEHARCHSWIRVRPGFIAFRRTKYGGVR